MFGKSVWFRPKTARWGLHPTTWQGWAYSMGWIGVIALPFVALISRQQIPESLIWLTASLGTFAWDVRAIRRELQPQIGHAVLFIHEDGTTEQLLTRNVVASSGKALQAGK
jgi:hypothetical protein